MKKGPKIIQISGISGLAFTMFIIVCGIAGFVIFPAKVAVSLWNWVLAEHFAIPSICLWQGILLWSMTVLSFYLFNRKQSIISFKQPMELNENEMRTLMQRIQKQNQAQKLNAMLIKSKDLQISNKELEIKQDEEKQQEKQS